jgi:hypothetical protein
MDTKEITGLHLFHLNHLSTSSNFFARLHGGVCALPVSVHR